MVVVEALAAARPVVAPAEAGPLEILGEGRGLLYPPGDATAAARAWYDSPAYQEVAQHRFKGARYRAVLVEGV